MGAAPTGIDYLLQFGGLGLAGYLIWWITRKLNGKLDRLTEAVMNLTDAQRQSADATKKLSATLESRRYEVRVKESP